MHLCTLILGIWLLPKVNTLKCYECLPSPSGSCTDTPKECPTDKCSTLKMVTYAGTSKVMDMTMKTCAVGPECVDASVNFGISKTLVANKCCTTALCNDKPGSDFVKSKPNGKKCFTCDGYSCTSTLSCEGSEDHCVKATTAGGNEKVTLKGCASKMACSGQIKQQMAQSMGEFTCCQGDFCNSGSSVRAGLLLLVVPLISLVLCS
ncbi:urokinase plasminogen activator surface receptor-like [Cololabis saira]|uniref:urokinase plasminogen activator surface receptor-like n=1 Tax=Cololabis saira TaxID=129043 RepID=UPI002AD4164B|nr:urokinase plasminogen activator surface receptor-like [Cololabis saira]